jgi:dinuclear metal center YbgI/SA1388 family protein
MKTISDLLIHLETVAPLELAENWDNVGLLVGDPSRQVQRVMTALTVVPTNVQEAIDGKADIIVTHHPLPFHPLKKITTDSVPGKLLWRLMGAGISIFSPHTAWDNAASGINRQLAELLRLTDIEPLQPSKNARLAACGLGTGRIGLTQGAISLGEIASQISAPLKAKQISLVGPPEKEVKKVGIVCGSGASLLAAAHAAGCDTFLTGEATFHQCLEAESYGMSMILLGHFASEKFGLCHLTHVLQHHHPEIHFWSSSAESEPASPFIHTKL